MNYHAILGIRFDASAEDAKKAYKKLAMIHHPDRGGDEELFKQIKEAYEWVLENPYVAPVRSSFSNDGYAQPRPNPDGVKTPFKSAFDEEGDPYAWHSKFGGVEINIPKDKEKVHSEFGFKGWEGNNTVHYHIPLELAYTGGRIRLNIPNYQPTEITLQPLTEDGFIRTISVGGSSHWLGGRDHSLKVKFNIVPHETYRLKDSDLYCTFKLSLIDLLDRVPLRIPHPNGKQLIPINLTRNYELGSLIEIPDLGFPQTKYGMRNNRGSIFVSILTDLPQLNNDQLNRIRNIMKE